MTESKLLAQCRRAVDLALEAGADEAEVCAGFGGGSSVSFENNDIQIAMSDEEVTFGLRVIADSKQGFAATNDPETLAESARDALAIAKSSVVDEHLGLAEPVEVTPIQGLYDDAIAGLSVSEVTGLGVHLLDAVRSHDPRPSVDSGSVTGARSVRAIASSTGINLSESTSYLGGSLFGMAVDGDEVGSFVSEGRYSRSRADFEAALTEAGTTFSKKAIGALHPGKGVSFKGQVLFSPEAVASLLVSNLVTMVAAPSIRKGKSPLANKFAEKIASTSFQLYDDGTIPGAVGSSSFDREGMPHRRVEIIKDGIFSSSLFNHYEARAAKHAASSTGHASGGANAIPGVSTSQLEVAAGEYDLEALLRDTPRTVLVNRFSGSTNAVTGEFSGVVKSGYLIERGERRPITETLISGNLLDLYRNITAITADRVKVHGLYMMPYILADGISVTAG
ncbi:MAG: TldD/PmbA family protein [Planctomycetota bacterium]